MPQTENTLRALQRDENLCQWCLVMEQRLTTTKTGHHIIGRARSDRIEDIIALCQEHHDMAGAYEITQAELYDILAQQEFWRSRS